MKPGIVTVRLKRGVNQVSGAMFVTEDMIERRWHALAWYRVCDVWYWLRKKVGRP